MIIEHLKERHLDISLYSSIEIVEELEQAYFYLYNLSGQIVGFQCYSPLKPKRLKAEDIYRRYYTYITKEYKSIKATAFGLEILDLKKDKVIFLVEGVFDAVRLHKLGFQALALLGSDALRLREQLLLLGCTLIPVCEGDEAGQKLQKLATSKEVIFLPEGEDVSSLEHKELVAIFKKFG